MNWSALLHRTLFWRLLGSLCVANLLILMLGSWIAGSFISFSEDQKVDWTTLAASANDAYVTNGRDGLREWVRKQRDNGIETSLYEDGRSIARDDLSRSVSHSISDWIRDGHDVEQNPSPGYFIAFKQVMGSDHVQRDFIGETNPRGRISRHDREHVLFATQVGLLLVFIVLIGWWTASSVSRPIEIMREATQRMAKGDFSTRVPSRWSRRRSELGDLSRDFNAMAERIGVLIDHERSILQDLSHELRSPLARLLASLDLTRRQNQTPVALMHIHRAEQEVARMDRITSEMLALSRLEADLPGMERERVDIVSLLKKRIESARIEAEKKHIQCELSHSGTPTVLGSEILLERVFDNLLNNAMKYSPHDARIEIYAHQNALNSEIGIRDYGPGIPDEDMDGIFRPFFRGKNAPMAPGHGLGLSVVRRIVDLHGGDIRLANVSPQGLQVVLNFPA
jgi:two-component system OmpR family sensor kinase